MNTCRFWVPVVLAVLTGAGLDGAPQRGGRPTPDTPAPAQADTLDPAVLAGLTFRSIGPAWCSGRIADFAVNPANPSEYFVAVASGHIWKTTNAGTTWQPVFDQYGAYSIGCLAMDPQNPHVVWAGTGENNHQRALGYGNGVWRTADGGRSWTHMGLRESRQIGMIAIDPRNSSVVYVAAEGSAWGPGGDRGLYKTVDGGRNWAKILDISPHTGINNVVLDPRYPDIVYATSEQRRRHVHTKIGGGPESGIHKSEDGGTTWRRLTSGLPTAHMGGIGIAVSPVNPDVVFAIIEAADQAGGFFRSDNRGESWVKMSGHHSSGQYYNEIFCDPKDVDVIYSVETFSHVTRDGGRTWSRLNIRGRHVDDHAMWINPADTRHYRIGGDGGIYETWDGGETWHFKANLPITQFYRVNVDNDLPFYNVYGGTQDNNSMVGPSRNLRADGVPNESWVVTNGGDGFWTAADPDDPNIVYAEAQYGNMVRFDRRSEESLSIRPEPGPGELTYRWNWNAPLFISPHRSTRLYCAAERVFRSEDRGDSWTAVSGDLTAQIDRNTWPVMDKFWSVDAVAKDVSTSLFGTIVALAESPVRENLLYAGTDDGLIQISEDAQTWRRVDTFPGVPEHTYVSAVRPCRFEADTVFAAFSNLKRDDFQPYLLKSTDRGQTWVSIAAGLPENGSVHAIEQDHLNPGLLFVGTEFGCFFTVDAGQRWHRLRAGLPDVAVYDLAIQRRESDLVLATFGRGFYILDDYSPLRALTPALTDSAAHLFPVRHTRMYIEQRGRPSQGSSYYTAPNPPFGALFTYYLKEAPRSRRAQRKEAERPLFRDGLAIPQPSLAELRAEEREDTPHLVFTITDDRGEVVRRLTAPARKGIHRESWDLRYPSVTPPRAGRTGFDPLVRAEGGIPVMPGRYQVALSLFQDGQLTALAGPVEFTAQSLDNTTLPAPDRSELVAFQRDTQEINRVLRGARQFVDELEHRITQIRQALHVTPGATPDLIAEARRLADEIDDLRLAFDGPPAKASREEVPPSPVSLLQRVSKLVFTHWRSTSAITDSQRVALRVLIDEFPPVRERLKRLAETDLPALEREMEKLRAPWTPGRLPAWPH